MQVQRTRWLKPYIVCDTRTYLLGTDDTSARMVFAVDEGFQSAEEAEAFITGCYQAITFGGWWNINTVWLLSEMCSDDGWMGPSNGVKGWCTSLTVWWNFPRAR